MVFYNREDDIRRMKAVLSGDPNLLYFVYGPINSGKTALLMKVLEELPEEFRVFYINFRWRDVERIEDFLQVLFKVRRGDKRDNVKEFTKDLIREGFKALGKLKGIPIPERIFDYLFLDSKKADDIFEYMEDMFEEIVEEGFRPVLVFDELQSIKDILNATGKPVLGRLFNFLVGMTKEKHLCHSLCSTSDCLFIEDIYSNARLEGRAKYILVDDLPKDDAYKLYEGFGFEDKVLVWDWIGGKVGDMIRLYEKKKQGYSEEEGLRNMLKDEVGRLEDLLEKIGAGRRIFNFEGGEFLVDISKVEDVLRIFKTNEEVSKKGIDLVYRNYLIYENILFYNPLEGTIRPQGRLLLRAIREVIGG